MMESDLGKTMLPFKVQQLLDCIIIGGGISGISFAHYLHKAGKNAIILEKEDRPGGQICTKTSAADNDFWIELGTHTCYNSYTHFLSMIAEAGLSDKLLAPAKQPYKLYADGKVKGIMSRLSLVSLIPGCFRVFAASKQGKSVREFFAPIVGERNYNRLFRYLFRAVICQEADDYPAEFFLKKRKGRVEAVPRKFSYRGGFSALVDDLIVRDGLKVQTNTAVVSVERDGDGYRVLSADGQEFRARGVAFAINPLDVSRMIKTLSPQLAGVFGDIPVSKSESLGIVVRKNDIDMPKAAIIISTCEDLLSVVSRDVHDHPTLRGFAFHFHADGKPEAEKLVLACRVLGIRESDVLQTMSASHILPSSRVRHTDLIDKVNRLRGDERLYFPGNYYYGLSIEDCVHRAYEEATKPDAFD